MTDVWELVQLDYGTLDRGFWVLWESVILGPVEFETLGCLDRDDGALVLQETARLGPSGGQRVFGEVRKRGSTRGLSGVSYLHDVLRWIISFWSRYLEFSAFIVV